MGTEGDGRCTGHVLNLQPLTPTGISKFLFLPLAKYIVNAEIGTPFYELDANEMLLYAHIYNLADQTRRRQGGSFSNKDGRTYILPDNYELCCFMRSSASTIKRTLKKLQSHEMIEMERSRCTRQRILYVKESFIETECGERVVPASPMDLPFMTGKTPSLRGFYRIPLTLCGRRGERRNVYSENLNPEKILIYSVLLDTALSAANTDAYIESEEEPYIYVRYGYESLGKRIHVAKASGGGENTRATCPHSTLSSYIQALEGGGKWSGLIHHIRPKHAGAGYGNLKGASYYSVHDYSVSGNEDGFYLEAYDEYLSRMKRESEENGISLEDLLKYGQYGYKKEPPPGDGTLKDSENILVADGNDGPVQGAEAGHIQAEEVKTELRRNQKRTTKGSKPDYGEGNQNRTSKGSKPNHEEARTGQRRGQNETVKEPKPNHIKKDSTKKERLTKKPSLYISSSQDACAIRLHPWEAEILPPAGAEEEETDRVVYPFNPHAPGAREILKGYHRRKRMRCDFDEFWQFNENKNWMANGKRVEDPVALLVGYETRYIREHPMQEVLYENGMSALGGDPDLADKKRRLLQSLMSNRLYGKNVTNEAYVREHGDEPG